MACLSIGGIENGCAHSSRSIMKYVNQANYVWRQVNLITVNYSSDYATDFDDTVEVFNANISTSVPPALALPDADE